CSAATTAPGSARSSRSAPYATAAFRPAPGRSGVVATPSPANASATVGSDVTTSTRRTFGVAEAAAAVPRTRAGASAAGAARPPTPWSAAPSNRDLARSSVLTVITRSTLSRTLPSCPTRGSAGGPRAGPGTTGREDSRHDGGGTSERSARGAAGEGWLLD